jgi:hypothetical protein
MTARSVLPLILQMGLVLTLACGDDGQSTAPTESIATVEIAYLAPTRPTLPPSVDGYVQGVG